MRVLVFILLLIGTANAQPMRFFTGAMGQFAPIVTNGLLYAYDAGNSASSNGVSPIWYDVSGNGNNAGFSNATFNTSKGGYINVFGGGYASNSYLLPSLTGSYTFCGVLIQTNNTIPCLSIGSVNDNVWQMAFISNGTNKWRFYAQFSGNITKGVDGTINASATNFSYVVGVVNSGVSISLYVNGTLDQTLSITNTTLLSSTKGLYINRWSPDQSGLSSNFPFAAVQLYNRVLTTTEITQNYNAMRTEHQF